MTRLPPDFWAVNEDDEKVGILQLLAAFFTFALLLAVILGVVVLAWSAR